MIRLAQTFCLLAAFEIFLPGRAWAQQPTPALIVVQAANTTPSAPVPQLPTQDSTSIKTAIKTLQEMKAGNDDILKKQDAALQQLEEMQKAAEQLKIFSHRSGG
jgi:hypothetical protein